MGHCAAMARRRKHGLRLLPVVALLGVLLGGCSPPSINGVDATSDGVPIVRNCGAYISGVRVIDADSRRLVWAAGVSSGVPTRSARSVGQVTIGQLPDSTWIDNGPAALSPR